MLRAVLVYEARGTEMPLLETRQPAMVRALAAQCLHELAAGAAKIEDPILRLLVEQEREQAQKVLAAAGLEVQA